jgi:excisionase family DNA binding protein
MPTVPKDTALIEMPAGVNYDPPLTLEQAAAYLNASVRNIHRYKNASKIDFYKYDGSLRFRVSALERFLAKRRVKAA